MRQRLTLNVIIIVVLLGSAAYFSYQVFVAYSQSQAVKKLRERAFSAENFPPPASEVGPLIAEVERKLAQVGGDQLRLMHMQLLLLRASYYPEQSVADLRQALSIGQEFYALPNIREDLLAPELARVYLIAGLPAKLERWQAEALTVAPQERPLIRYLQIYGRILSDAPQSARLLIAKELDERGSLPDIKLLALCGYTVLDDLESADDMAAEVAAREQMPLLFRYPYADYLMGREQFAAAEDQLRQAIGADPAPPDVSEIDPDDALLLATAIAGHAGLGEPDVLRLLEQAAHSTRYPRSVDGAAAAVANSLFWATGDQAWWGELKRLHEQQPEDANVALALADASLHRLPAGTASEAESEAAPESGPLAYARAALALASTDYERQAAHLLMARAWPSQPSTEAQTEATLEDSVRHLQIALGDPKLSVAVVSERMPDYELFLLDRQIIAAREADPAYDEAVHRAIIDYLNRRQELFADAVSLAPLSYEWIPEE